MPSSSAMSAACRPPAPPKPSSASSRGSTPRSTVITRSARTISALATRRMPSAHSSGSSSRLSASASTACSRGVAVERDVAAERRARGQQAEHEVGVGDRRLRAAVAVAGGAGAGARRARADAQRAARVAPADRAAAGADGVDVEHRQRDRPPADLAPGRLAHRAVEDHADVARRAAHVEAQRVGLARGRGRPGRAGGAAGRAGEHRERRVRGGVRGARQPAAGLHHGGLGQPGLARALDEPAQVGAQQGGEGGVDLGRRRALELAEGADHLVRERDVHVAQALGQRVAERPLVLAGAGRRAAGRRRRPRARRGDRVDRGAQRVVAERLQRAVGAHPLRGADPPLGRHERRRVRRAQAVEVGARLAAELDDVLEALGGDEHRPGALALEQRVGGDRRAVRERLDLLRRRRRRARAPP